MIDKRRYPGISPFSEEQKDLFFGRDKDIKKLERLIKLRQQVLLYSKSGVGKTSLLNAGVLPGLKNDFIILKIRFFSYNPKDETIVPPAGKIINTLLGSFKDLEQQKTIVDQLSTEKNIWFWLKKLQVSTDNKPVLLVFDQFEELFSYPEEMIEDFKKQLQQILNNQIPDEVLSFIEEHPEIEEQADIIYENFEVKTVYAIRSDRLSLLNRLTDRIPDIQNNFYELLPLTRQQAKNAIIKPASAEGDFISTKFDFDEPALQNILNVLTDKYNLTVETTQLQIVCQRIEDIAIEKKKNKKKNASIIIHTNDLPEFKDIFVDFYKEALNKIPVQRRQKVAILIEDNLIINEQRITLHEAVCKKYATDEDLRILTNIHLLRAENTSTGIAYELSHDTLVEPILEVRKIRKEEEARRLEEMRQQEELRKLQEQRRRQRTIIMIVSIAAVVSISLAIFGFVMWQNAKRQTEIAKQKEKEANEILQNLKRSEFNRLNEKANALCHNKNYADAVKVLNQAFKWTDDSLALQKRIDSLSQIAGKETQFNKLISQAKQYEKDEANWLKALELYDQAAKLHYDDTLALAKKNSLQKRLNSKLLYYKSKAKEYINKGPSFRQSALEYFIFPGLKLSPNDPELLKLKQQAQK